MYIPGPGPTFNNKVILLQGQGGPTKFQSDGAKRNESMSDTSLITRAWNQGGPST